MLSPSDHDKIAAAVAKAEADTSGEILCVLARHVSNYRETPLAWAAIVALLAAPVGLLAGAHPLMLSLGVAGWAIAGPPGALLAAALTGYALLQVILFALVVVILTAWRPLKLALTPRALKHRRVRQAALAQLMATRLLGAQIGAAVVIFASLEDRMVAVVGDEAIHQKVGDQAWDAAVAAVLKGVRGGDPAGGFIAAVELCGGVLAEHFPVGAPHAHLADGVVEI